MQDITLIGIDLGKHGFHLHGQDKHGKSQLRRKFDRKHLITYLANFQPCTIVMEACAGAHWMARQLSALGHEAKLISPSLSGPSSRATRTTSSMRKRSARQPAVRQCVS